MKKHTKVKNFVSECETLFNKLTKEYGRKITQKFNAINKVTDALITQLDFLREFEIKENKAAIEIKYEIKEDGSSSLISILNCCPRIVQIHTQNIEEEGKDILFDFHLFVQSDYEIYNDKIDLIKACHVLAIAFYLILVEKKSLNLVNATEIDKIYGSLYNKEEKI